MSDKDEKITYIFPDSVSFDDAFYESFLASIAVRIFSTSCFEEDIQNLLELNAQVIEQMKKDFPDYHSAFCRMIDSAIYLCKMKESMFQ